MKPGTRTIHAFCSAKGGVGKSTLAVACAKLLAAGGRRCVLIDADLTGTSLADGLRLCAPEVVTKPDGRADLDAAPRGYLDRDATLRLRAGRERARASEPLPPAFLNDALLHGHERWLDGEGAVAECNIATILWKHERDDGVLYVPSSPLRPDVKVALGWLYYEERHAWIQRMTWLIDGMVQQMPELTDIVLDLPPGLFGFADEVLSLLSHLDAGIALPPGYPETWGTGGVLWRARPFLVTTPDRNDLAVALGYFLERRADLPSLTLLINNRINEPIEEIVKDAGKLFGIVAPGALESVGYHDSLALVFSRTGDLQASSIPDLRRPLGLTEQEGAS